MNLRGLSDKAKGVDKKILDLIDIKINNDMREVITEIRTLDKEIKGLEKEIRSTNRTIYIIGGAITLILAIIALKN